MTKQSRHKHTGRYVAVYERGHALAIDTSIHDTSVDYHTGRMSVRAQTAFEDGYFDGKMDLGFAFCSDWEEPC